MAQFSPEKISSQSPEAANKETTSPTFWEKWNFEEYTPEELDEIREELNGIWHARSKTVDTEDLLVSHLPDEALMVYDKFGDIKRTAEQDKNWQEWLGRYLSADEKEDFEGMKEIMSGITGGGVKNWSEIYQKYREAMEFIGDYRQEFHADLVDKHGETYQNEDLFVPESSVKELISMMVNDLEKRMAPLIRCKTKAEREERERQGTRKLNRPEGGTGLAT